MADFKSGKTANVNPGQNSAMTQVSFEPSVALPTSTKIGQSACLSRSVLAWFIVTAIGQLSFVAMIVIHYGWNTVRGDLPKWNDKPLITGFVAGDTPGNVMFAAHVLPAALVTICGLMQLNPQIRRRWPRLHRLSGRVFIVLSGTIALGGLWLTWVRGSFLSTVSASAVSLNGALIVIAIALAWRTARRRDFAAHRIWALRAFMLVNGVWFLRVGIMFWAMTTGGIGMSHTMSGSADIVLEFGAYLVPLGVLQLYLIAEQRDSGLLRLAVSWLILSMTAMMAFGIYGTIAFMWWPYMW